MLSDVLTYHVLHRSNQFREDLGAAKYLLRSGVRISSNLNSGRHNSQETVPSLSQELKVGTDDCLNQLTTSDHSLLQHSSSWSPSLRSCCHMWQAQLSELSEYLRDAGKEIGKVSSSSTLQSGRTGQILESGKDLYPLYCIYVAQQKDSEGSRSVHTRNCVWLKI